MGSTLRSDVSKALYLERMLRSWEKCDELPFGQFIAGVLDHARSRNPNADLHTMTNTELIEATERFILLGDSIPPKTLRGTTPSGSL